MEHRRKTVYDEHLLWVRLERESYWYRIRMAVKFPERFLSIIIDGELNFQNFKIIFAIFMTLFECSWIMEQVYSA